MAAFAAVPTLSVEVGPVKLEGSTSTADGVYTVAASGADTGGGHDEFRFVYGSLGGDGEITARVDSLSATDAWAKAGVMIRETLDSRSPFAYMLVSEGSGADFEHRFSQGTPSLHADVIDEATRAPSWVRVRRIGDDFTAYVSADGQEWRQHGPSLTIAMENNVYVGLAVTSHEDGVIAKAAFSNVNFGAVDSTSPAPNLPPSISGTPPTAATVGAQYAFTPIAKDSDGDTLTYSITRLPTWATFSNESGRLAGTPASSNVGTYGDIVIGVSDGQAMVQLPAFSIVVSEAEGVESGGGVGPDGGVGSDGNRAPVISGVPTTSVTQGMVYSFQPTASDADGDPLTFSISNTPRWATFNATTGRLQGTPTINDVGTYSNVVIGVTDGTTTSSLAAFSITVLGVGTSSATLSWTPPTTNADGSRLTNLSGYRVYWGTAAGSYPNSVTLDNAGLTSYVVTDLAPGTYYFVVTARNSAGVESAFSNVASTTIQ